MDNSIRADFALKTKHPGDTQDYRVLICGKYFLSEQRFEQIFYDLSVGQMPEERNTPGEEPPWITLGPVTDGTEPYLAIVRQEWTDQRDHVGRRIKLSSCLCLRYVDLAVTQTTLADLLAQIPPSQELLQYTRQFVPLSFDQSTERYRHLADVIDTTGYEFIAAVAALVITRPVALVGASNLTVEQRLDCLDAVLSLLPYGSRAAISLSTWMKSSVDHAIRLGFSNSARPEQEIVQWQCIPELDPGSLAHEYYLTLCDIKKNYPVFEIMTWLAQQGDVQTLTQPQQFLDTLSKLNQPYVILSRVQHGRGQAREVRALFNSGAAKHLKPDEQHMLLAWLLQQPTEENLAVVEQHWHPNLTADLCQVTQSLIAQPVRDQEAILNRLCTLAHRVGNHADLLVAALEQANTATEPTSYAIVVRLVHTFFVYDQRIAHLLWNNPQLRYEFALQTAQYRQDADQRLAWLEPQRNQAQSSLAVVRIALNLSQANPHQEMLAPLAQANPDYVRRLFKVALDPSAPSVDRLTPVIVEWLLAHLATLNLDAQEKWGVLLRSLKSVQQPELQARIDLLILAFEAHPTLPSLFLDQRLQGSPDQFQRYSEALGTAVRPLPEQQREGVVADLLRIIAGLSRYKPENMLALGTTLWSCTNTMRSAIATQVIELLRKHGQLRQDQNMVRRWEQRLAELGMVGAAFEVQSWQLDRSTSLPDIVQHCADNLYEHRTNVAPIIPEMKKLLTDRSFDFTEFISILLDELGKRHMPSSEIDAIEHELLQNNPHADAYLQQVVRDVYADLERLQQLLPLMKDRLGERKLTKLHKLLQKLANLSQPPGLFSFWKK